jgi:hypothetical protein
VVITPLIGLVPSSQLGLLRSARARPHSDSQFACWSWDHLFQQGHHPRPAPIGFRVERRQRHEALEMHGVPAERVVVTGAAVVRRWFDQRPSRSRADFHVPCRLPPQRPFVLLGVFGALFQEVRPEAQFVLRWAAALRSSSDPVSRDAPILGATAPVEEA